eukprot:scaffold99419_cov39-Phaeocystis_antarctica.AAC.1
MHGVRMAHPTADHAQPPRRRITPQQAKRLLAKQQQGAGVRRAGGKAVPREGVTQAEEAAQRRDQLGTRHEERVKLAWAHMVAASDTHGVAVS